MGPLSIAPELGGEYRGHRVNYFAHGYRHLHDPYFLAGTAVPDWLGAADRKVRVRAKSIAPFLEDPDERIRGLARGIRQHLREDAWFHEQVGFVTLSAKFSGEIHALFPEDNGPRSHFLGHILVELLLDAELIRRDGDSLERYYQVLQDVDHLFVESGISRMATQPTDRLAKFMGIFVQLKFLSDYVHDGKLMERINQVMLRVGLPTCDDRLMELIPSARRRVAREFDELYPADLLTRLEREHSSP